MAAASLELVSAITDRLVSSLDFDDALRTLIEGATELLGVERGSLMLLDPASGTLSIKVARGLRPEVVEATRIRLGQGIAGRVAASGEPIVARDVRELREWRRSATQPADYADFSALCVPLTLHGKVQGVMSFNHKRNRQPFGAGDLQFALLIANQAAVVLHSARMHHEYVAKQALEQELALARTIQQRLQPQVAPELPGFRFAATSRMCQQVGGDLHDFVALDGDRLAVYVGDVAGHGIGSALLAADARSALRESLLRGDGLQGCLEHVNDLLQADTGAEMYMTLLIGILDGGRPALHFATAGHHMPLLVRGGEIRRLPAAGTNIPLGIRRGLRFGVEEPLLLHGGDLVVLFTDGLWEATDTQGRRFGTAGLERTLRKHHQRSESEIVDALIGAADRYRAAPEPEDDYTVVVLRRT